MAQPDLDAKRECSKWGANPTQVTVASNTVTTNTTFNANAPNDRIYQFANDIAGTVDAGVLVAGFGLNLQSTAAGGGVSMTNDGFITVDEAVPALQLIGNGGAVAYAGTGAIINNNSGSRGLEIINSGTGTVDVTIAGMIAANGAEAVDIEAEDGNVTFTQAAGTFLSSTIDNTEDVVGIDATSGNIVANLNGTIFGTGDGLEADSITGNVTVNFTGSITVQGGVASIPPPAARSPSTFPAT